MRMQLICQFLGRTGFFRNFFKKSSSSASTSNEPAPVNPASTPKPKEEKRVKVKKTDNNALVVHLNALSQEPVPSTNEPWYCRKCEVAVSSLSKLSKVGETVSWEW